MKNVLLKWCYTRDLHRKDEPGRIRTEKFSTPEGAERRWASIVRFQGGSVTRIK